MLTVFYSSSLFPVTTTTNEHLEPLDLEAISEDKVRDLAEKECVIAPDVLDFSSL